MEAAAARIRQCRWLGDDLPAADIWAPVWEVWALVAKGKLLFAVADMVLWVVAAFWTADAKSDPVHGYGKNCRPVGEYNGYTW